MKIKTILLFVFIFFQASLFGQSANASQKNQPLSVFDGSQTIATSYTFSACGLNYLQVSNPLYGRSGNNFTLSVAQPAAFMVPALPACAVIERMFLYVGTSGTGTNISVSVTNPGGGNSIYPLILIGSGPDKNWGYAGSFTYRADITNMFSGAGNYFLSGIPSAALPAANDANGATLLIIYSDRTQNYTGSIVIADGSLVNTTNGVATATIGNFNVCGTPTLSSHFMLVDDLQQYGISNLMLNSAVPNFTQLPALTTPWEFFSAPGAPVSAGQNSAVYGISNLLDTVGLLMAGMYYRSACLTCPHTLTVSAASTPSCLATATVNVSGGSGPYTYTWTGSAQNASVITDLAAGTQTVTVRDQMGCLSGSATLVASTPAPSIAVTDATACIGFSALVSAGPAQSYTWSPAASLNNPNAQNVNASPLVTTIYTLDYTNALGCTGSQTAQVTVTNTQTIAGPNNTATLCAGQTLSLSANGFAGSGYLWMGPAYTSTLSDPVIVNATVAMSGVYNLSVTSVAGCTSMAASNVTVFPLPTPGILSNGPLCTGFNLNLFGSGATQYTWLGPNGFTSAVQNPTINNAGILATGIYTLTGSFASGCSQTATSSVLVNNLPVPSILTNTNVCVGKNVTFSASSSFNQYAWVGPNNFSSSLPSPSIIGISLLANGVYTLTVTDANGCQGQATTTMAALANPTVSATGTAVCYGAAATLTANGLGFYTWLGPNGYSVSPLVPFASVPVVDNLSSGVYTVQLISLLTTCSAQATTTLGTIPLPTVVASGSVVCFNEPATLSVTGAPSYLWQGPNSYTAVGANPVVPVVNTTGVWIFTVTGTAANTCTSVTTTSVTTIPLPTVSATGTLICLNEPFTLTSTGAVAYAWKGPSSYSATGSSAFVPIVNNLSAGEYTVVGTAPNTCTSDATAMLVTMPLPSITATGTVVCLNEPALLQSAGGMGDGSGYTWRGPQGYISHNQDASVSSATNAPVSIYTVVGTALNTCTNAATASLVTLPLPTVTATGTLICFGEPFNIMANGAATYTWAGPQNYSWIGASAPVPVVDFQSSGTYTVVGTALNTCTQVTTATLATMPLPQITATGTIVCISQQPAVLLANGGIGGGYSWYGPGGYISYQQNAYVYSATSPVPQNYTVVGTAPNTCTNDAVATLSTFPLPEPTFIAPARACFGTSVTLQGFGAQTYTWSGPYDQVYHDPDPTFPIYNLAQSGTYTLSVTDLNNCRNYTTTNISIDPTPSGQLLSDNGNKYCVPFHSTFHLKSTEAAPIVSVAWIVKGIPVTGETFSYEAEKAGTDTVTGFFTDLNGCSNTLTFAVQAYPSPRADFIFAPEKPVENLDLVEFSCSSEGKGLSYWNWFFVNNEGFHSTIKSPSYVFDSAGNYEVAMVVENSWGCTDTVTKVLAVNSDFKLYVPNVFTPNGDGLNDVFQPKGRGIKTYDFTIYNRWGALMFSTSDFEKGWDGITNGNMSENDTYIWKIHAVDAYGKKRDLSGHVTLSR
jgi:gliding motility-associated-like protein